MLLFQLVAPTARANFDQSLNQEIAALTPEQIKEYGQAQVFLLNEIIQTTEGLSEISSTPALVKHIQNLKELRYDAANGRIESYLEKREQVFTQHEVEVKKVLSKDDSSISARSLISLAAVSASVGGYAWQKIRGPKVAPVATGEKCFYALEVFMNEVVTPVGAAAWGRALVDRMPKILFHSGATGIAVMTSWDMVDRYLLGGADALFNMASGLDALLILAILPRPALKSFEHKYLGRMAMKIAGLQQKASFGLMVGSGAYGLWQVLGAESISEKLKQDGYEVSAGEIRARGITDLLISLWGGRAIYQESQKRLLASPFYSEFAKTQKTFLRSYWETIKHLNPLKAVGHFKQAFATNWRTAKGAYAGTKEILTGSFYGGFQYFVYSTLALLAYGYPDFMLNANASGIPQLKDGEIAVELNGFAPHDVLYYAVGGRSELSEKNQKLLNQGKLVRHDIQSPSDFLSTLRSIGEKKGKIRHLKIQSHGVPGTLVFNASSITGEGEVLVNERYLIEHLDELREISQKYFAPDATIEIYSCLVGANLDAPTTYKGMLFEKDVGDRFINKLGESLLVKGGRVESSKRFLFGVEATYGALYNKMAYGDYKRAQSNSAKYEEKQIIANQVIIKSSAVKTEESKAVVPAEKNNTTEAAPSDSNNKTVAPDYYILSTSAGKRVWDMFFKLNEITYKFGVNLEGPYWADAFRRDEFLPQE